MRWSFYENVQIFHCLGAWLYLLFSTSLGSTIVLSMPLIMLVRVTTTLLVRRFNVLLDIWSLSGDFPNFAVRISCLTSSGLVWETCCCLSVRFFFFRYILRSRRHQRGVYWTFTVREYFTSVQVFVHCPLFAVQWRNGSFRTPSFSGLSCTSYMCGRKYNGGNNLEGFCNFIILVSTFFYSLSVSMMEMDGGQPSFHSLFLHFLTGNDFYFWHLLAYCAAASSTVFMFECLLVQQAYWGLITFHKLK